MAEAAILRKAASLGLSPDAPSGASTLGEPLGLWLAEIVSSRNIRPQTALIYRTKANRLAGLDGGIEVPMLRSRRMQVIVNDLAKGDVPLSGGVSQHRARSAVVIMPR